MEQSLDEPAVDFDRQDPVVKQGGTREVLGGPAENLAFVGQHRAASAQETVLRIASRWSLPPRRHASFGEKSHHSLAQSVERVDEILADPRVASRKDNRPGEVAGRVENSGPSRGASNGGNAFLRAPGQERAVRMDPDTVRDGPVDQYRNAHGGDRPPEDRLIRADILRAGDPHVDPRGETDGGGRTRW